MTASGGLIWLNIQWWDCVKEQRVLRYQSSDEEQTLLMLGHEWQHTYIDIIQCG
jgi:hypothetical protein